ncbi:RNA polymerase sigma-70 factor, ECF subfamily [Actinopolyspora lacussalsi subsp. righensis]|uniref:RNA polymerase sigma-70 factor, ECF subfamily n=1 Tax=Actinopolyspora righensis TaxID=995060 RepID=A0A1I6Y7Z8_9ACTN|nr:RNA polymerase sigma factor [Actinopolyspora righensis]SFT46626.1 RNA polymerase sigma-70 factor, ECF subfamily [Actinopolyspora righensis]
MRHGRPSDERLMRAVARGDAEALAELYDRHAPWLFLRLKRRCSDQGVVEEVAQDTFLGVWRYAKRYERGNIGGWIWTIAARRLIDAQRARGARPEQASEVIDTARTTPSAEQHALSGVEHGELGAALYGLSPELRDVVRATIIDGMSMADAATVLGIPEGTVKTRVRRARVLLREALA